MRKIRPEWEDFMYLLEDFDNPYSDTGTLLAEMNAKQEYLFALEEYTNYLEQTLERYEQAIFDSGIG
jgi:hypothetical protein